MILADDIVGLIMRHTFAILLFTLSACSSQAPDISESVSNLVKSDNVSIKPIYYDGMARYQYEEKIKPEVLSECSSINRVLSESVQTYANGFELPLATEALDQLSNSDRILKIEIVDAYPGLFVFGNFGSVPAELNVEFKVYEGGEVILEKYRRCATNLAGFMGLQPSACNKLEKCAKNQGKYIVKYLMRSLYE